MHRTNGNGKGSLSQRHAGAVEDYTRPFLLTFALWFFCALTLVWAVWGYLVAIVVGVLAHHAVTMKAERRAARMAVTPGKEAVPPR